MPVFLKSVRSFFMASKTSKGMGEGPALKLYTLSIFSLLGKRFNQRFPKTQKEKTSHGTSFSFLAVPPNLAEGLWEIVGMQEIKNALHPPRDESTRDTTQIAFRPSLACCNGHIPKDSSSLAPKWKDNKPLATLTNRCLSEKVSLPLLHHRLLLRIIDPWGRKVKGDFWGRGARGLVVGSRWSVVGARLTSVNTYR